MMLASCCDNRGLLSFCNVFGAASFIGFKAVCAGDAPFALGGNGWGLSSTLLPGVAAFFWASAQPRELPSHIAARTTGLTCACCSNCKAPREKSNCLLED